jgi:hypothetical protein
MFHCISSSTPLSMNVVPDHSPLSLPPTTGRHDLFFNEIWAEIGKKLGGKNKKKKNVST